MRLVCAASLCLLLALPCRADDTSDANLTGDWFGYRTKLENAGVLLGADEILEPLANVAGGRETGTALEGRFELFANIDLAAAAEWSGAIFHVNAYQIHGSGLPAKDLGNLLTVSNIEADRATRLYSLWLQQSLFDDTVSVRLGQIAADDEFFVSQYAALFVNSTFGWPSILGINLPGGGPAYPLATPGLRVRAAITPAWTLSAAIFNGDPAPEGPSDPQQRNPSGTDFRLDGGMLMVGEASYAANIGGGLPGTFKAGIWYHDGRFTDQRHDDAGLSLADPASSGTAAVHRGDYGFYIVADQLLWRKSNTSDQGLGAFLRAGGAPPGRNLIEYHADAGLSYVGLLPGRDNDTVGLGISYESVSGAERALADDLRRLGGMGVPRPDFESALELSYQTQVAPCCFVQPDLQWIIHPGARILDLAAPQKNAEADALVLGLRTAVNL